MGLRPLPSYLCAILGLIFHGVGEGESRQDASHVVVKLDALAMESARDSLPSLPFRSAGAEAFKFFTVGDWGTRTSVQEGVANQMAAYAGVLQPSFIMALGDNVYEDGVTSADDPLWNSSFEGMYTSTELQVPWLALLGNHDYHSEPEAQLQYAAKGGRWKMDNYYYTRTVELEDAKTLQLVLIDTVSLAAKTHIDHVEKQLLEGQVSQAVLDKTIALAPELASRGKRQLQWIKSTLQASTADWLLVAGHFPVRSGGEHGDTHELVHDLYPMLEKYHVDAYLCGHDHTLQVLEEGNVTYYVSGGGGKDDGTYQPTKHSLYGTIQTGFMVHTITGDAMTVEAISSTGAVLYNSTLVAKRNR